MSAASERRGRVVEAEARDDMGAEVEGAERMGGVGAEAKRVEQAGVLGGGERAEESGGALHGLGLGLHLHLPEVEAAELLSQCDSGGLVAAEHGEVADEVIVGDAELRVLEAECGGLARGVR